LDIEDLLDQLDELLDKSWSLPLSGGRCVVDADRVRDYIDDIRINLPNEIKQAQAIVSDRADIIAAARREAEDIIRKAEEQRKQLVAGEEIAKAAQSKSVEMLNQTKMQTREMRSSAQEYSDNILRTAEEALTKSLTELRASRQALRNSSKHGK
jgi:cell division septum initiation protein DivIVA